MERTNDQPVSLPVPHNSTDLEQRGDSSSWDVDGLVKETSIDKALSSVSTSATMVAHTYNSSKVEAEGSGF